MKVLVFGATGQVGGAIAQLASPRLTVEALSRADADLADPDACAARIAATDADVVINAAAWTAVDAAENAPVEASVINREAPTRMAQACKAHDLPFIHISTEYVLGGNGDSPQDEDARVLPQSVYGRTKAAGEAGVRDSGARAVILRTSWVFSDNGSNFVRTMLRIGAGKDRLTIVDDQIGGPTPATGVAQACITIARALCKGGDGGTFHYAGAPDVSWAEFARAIFDIAGYDVEVAGQRSEDYPTPAERPKNSRMVCCRIKDRFDIDRPDWRAALHDVVPALIAKGDAA